MFVLVGFSPERWALVSRSPCGSVPIIVCPTLVRTARSFRAEARVVNRVALRVLPMSKAAVVSGVDVCDVLLWSVHKNPGLGDFLLLSSLRPTLAAQKMVQVSMVQVATLVAAHSLGRRRLCNSVLFQTLLFFRRRNLCFLVACGPLRATASRVFFAACLQGTDYPLSLALLHASRAVYPP